MTALTIAALVVIPAGIAFFAWLWIREGRDHAEARAEAAPQVQMWLENRGGYLPPKGPWMQPTPQEMDEYYAAARRRIEEEW